MENLYITEDSEGNELPYTGKVEALLADGAEEISYPDSYEKNMICVFHTQNDGELVYYIKPRDFNTINNIPNVEKTWLIYPWAKKLAK